MRKIAIIAAVTLVGFTIVGTTAAFGTTTRQQTAAQSASALSDGGTTRVLHLSNHFGETFQGKYRSGSLANANLGDVFSGSLYWFESDTSDQKVCLVGLTTTVVRVDPEVLLEGTLTAQFSTGFLAFQGLVDFDSDTPSEWAITGGTGNFLGATGSLVVEGPHVTITVHTP
jgi:Kef-type K+ transport system membrane component KefB